MVPSAGNIATIFLGLQSILLIVYLQKGKTINSEYYYNLLNQLNAKIDEERSAHIHRNI